MTAQVAIKQSDLKRLVAAVKDGGVAIEIEKDGMKIRVMPDNPDIHSHKQVPSRKGIRL